MPDGRLQRRLLAATVVGLTALSTVVAAGPTHASTSDGDRWETVCGAWGHFKTVGDHVQTKHIIDRDGKDGHHSGCFGIAPNGSIWWTGPTNPKWRPMQPYNGRAETVDSSYLNGGMQTISVRAPYPSERLFYQYWISGQGWNNEWEFANG